MNIKVDEKDLIAYLYGELEGAKKDAMEKYLTENPAAHAEFQKLQELRNLMGSVPDKEVIAPPVFVQDPRPVFFLKSPYVKTILSIAASILLILVVGGLSGARLVFSDTEVSLRFGKSEPVIPKASVQGTASLTPEQVMDMINTSLRQNNVAVQSDFATSQEKLNSSISKNLKENSEKIDQYMQQASGASQEQIQQYVSSLQYENVKLMKDYFQVSNSEQKKYMERMLTDFAKYLQQQRTNDLQVVQTRLNSLENNTNSFRQETEQLLSGMINSDFTETKNNY